MIHKGSNKNSLNIGNFRWNAKHERIVMSCLVSLVWFFGLYSSYISETIEDQSFAMGKAMERVRFLFLNAAFHAAFLCVCLAFGSKHLQMFLSLHLGSINTIDETRFGCMIGWGPGWSSTRYHPKWCSDLWINSTNIWQIQWCVDFSFRQSIRGYTGTMLPILKQRRSSPNASKEASLGEVLALY